MYYKIFVRKLKYSEYVDTYTHKKAEVTFGYISRVLKYSNLQSYRSENTFRFKWIFKRSLPERRPSKSKDLPKALLSLGDIIEGI